MCGKIIARHHLELLCANHCLKRGKILGQRGQHAEPVLAIVDFKPLEGAQMAVGLDVGSGMIAHAGAVVELFPHRLVLGERAHHIRRHTALELKQTHRATSSACNSLAASR